MSFTLMKKKAAVWRDYQDWNSSGLWLTSVNSQEEQSLKADQSPAEPSDGTIT
jgi:hypothetical protein